MFLVKADLDVPAVALPRMRTAPDAAFGIDAGVLAQAAAAFGTGELSRNPRQGTLHRLYRSAKGRMVRLAVFPGQPWAELMELECRLAPVLRSKGIPVPACEYREIAGRRGAQAVDLVQGESLDSRDADEAATLRGLRMAATLLARVHAIRGQGAGPLSLERLRDGAVAGLHSSWRSFVRLRVEEHLEQCEIMGAMSGEEAARALGAFNGPLLDGAPGGALLHGDPGSHNFIFRGDFLAAVIDWEDAMVGDPVFELASMCTFHPQRRHHAILEGYGLPLPRGSAEARRFWLYFLRIAIAKTVHRHRFGYVDAPGRMPAASRIQLALDGLDAA